MYLVPVEIKDSDIDGKGVFATQDIKKDAIAWKYTENHDHRITREAFNRLDSTTKKAYERVAYLSPTSGKWVIPPDDDPACYTNHSPDAYNTSVKVDQKISNEPFFIANRDIRAGEEITNNYFDFDENTKPGSSTWL